MLNFSIRHYLILLMSIIFFSAALSSPASAEETWYKFGQNIQKLTEEVTVLRDNEHIQTYQGVNGLWKKIEINGTISYIARRYGYDSKKISEINGISESSRVRVGDWLFMPYSDKQLALFEKKGITRQSLKRPRGEFVWPIEGLKVTSRLGQRWGMVHTGLDIAAPRGTLVLAALDGEVVSARRAGGYGITVVIRHDSEFTTLYAHLHRALVKKGDKVRKGQAIALCGNTGKSTGPHLHFEVRSMDIPLDPEMFLPPFKDFIETVQEYENNSASRKSGVVKN